jgi:hypothetical protein
VGGLSARVKKQPKWRLGMKPEETPGVNAAGEERAFS